MTPRKDEPDYSLAIASVCLLVFLAVIVIASLVQR